MWKRLAFITGTIITLDVRTTNTQCASAASSAAAHLHKLERAKIVKYADYDRAFRPFVIDLGGAVSEVSSGALTSITNEAAKASGPRLQWESFDWAVRLQRRIAVAMVRTTAWLATRAAAHIAASGRHVGAVPTLAGQPRPGGSSAACNVVPCM